MTRMAYEQVKWLRDNTDYVGRKALKESELVRLSFDGVDPLDIMSYLQGLKLFWY